MTNPDTITETRLSPADLVQAGEALSGTLNTIHNLAFYLGIMERVRREMRNS